MIAHQQSGREAQGFTLIEILIVIAIIGILVAAATPGLLTALDKSKQTSTMGLMRAFGTSLQIYQNDNGYYPQTAVAATLVPLLMPYSRTLRSHDGWKHELAYQSDAEHYTLECYGKDGVDGIDIAPETRNEFLRDIVMRDGTFTAAPQ